MIEYTTEGTSGLSNVAVFRRRLSFGGTANPDIAELYLGLSAITNCDIQNST